MKDKKIMRFYPQIKKDDGLWYYTKGEVYQYGIKNARNFAESYCGRHNGLDWRTKPKLETRKKELI